MLNYDKTRQWRSTDVRHTYTARDTMLYALGVGFGCDPLDPFALRYVYERDLQPVPSMASVLASPGFWMRDEAALGIDFMKLVHGEQVVTLHAPLPAQGTVVGRTQVSRIVDKGEGKGAVLHVEKQLWDADGTQLLAAVEQVLFCRGDGGFSAHDGRSDPPAPAAPAVPERQPDQQLQAQTAPAAALLYRLSGDLNPLHVDPAAAQRAGFPRPILHGLATYGIACRLLLQAHCADGQQRLHSLRARLCAPVYPGERLDFELWQQADGVAFRARVAERDTVVLSHGHATFQPAA